MQQGQYQWRSAQEWLYYCYYFADLCGLVGPTDRSYCCPMHTRDFRQTGPRRGRIHTPPGKIIVNTCWNNYSRGYLANANPLQLKNAARRWLIRQVSNTKLTSGILTPAVHLRIVHANSGIRFCALQQTTCALAARKFTSSNTYLAVSCHCDCRILATGDLFHEFVSYSNKNS